MSDKKHCIFVWAKDAGKFAKEYLEQNICGDFSIIVLGSELKIDDLKALQTINGIKLEIDNEYSKTQSETEIFLLGRLYELCKTDGISFVPYANLTKEASEVAKTAGINVLSWSALKGKPIKKVSTQSKRVKKVSSTTEELVLTDNSKKQTTEQKIKNDSIKDTSTPDSKKNVKKSTVKANISAETEAKMNAIVSAAKEGNSSNSLVSELIFKSKLTQEDKIFFTKSVNLTAISEAVKNASDENFLSFQLKMRFGERGEVLSPVLKKHFTKIRSM